MARVVRRCGFSVAEHSAISRQWTPELEASAESRPCCRTSGRPQLKADGAAQARYRGRSCNQCVSVDERQSKVAIARVSSCWNA